MGQIREVDAISTAINETEKEIAGDAWGNEDTAAIDESGDRTLESLGEGLEGQHEIDGEDDGSEEQDASEDGEDADGEGDGEEDEGEGTELAAGDGEQDQAQRDQSREQPAGRVPSGKLREEAERRRQLEQQLETERTGRAEDRKAFDALQAQVSTLAQLLQSQRQAPQPAKTEEPVKAEVPDIFENPTGFVEHITNLVQQAVAPVRADLRKQAVETSFAIAHATHKDAFDNALEAINGLNPQNPDDRATVQRIYNSPNPGDALVRWHKRNVALARVGEDPSAYEERIRKETRDTLIKDPEFRKQLLAELRGEAETGNNGAPRTETRLPKSLARAGGAPALGAERTDSNRFDNSDQSVADAAWR